MTDTERTPWGRVVRFLRKDVLDYTRPRFGDLAEVSDVTVYNWETGRKGVSLDTMRTLAEALVFEGLYWIELSDLLEPDPVALRQKMATAETLDDLAHASAKERILGYLRVQSCPVTDEEIARALNIAPSTAARRRRDLVAAGLVEESDDADGVKAWRAA